MHINLKLLEAVAQGDLPPRVLTEIARDHLSAICPVCREALEAYELLLKGGVGPEAYEKHFEAVKRKLGLTKREIRQEEKLAREWVRVVVAMPSEERRGKIIRAHKRFRGPLFCEMLLDEARKAMPSSPWESLSLADAAFAACYETNRFNPDTEILVQAAAVRGNASRALGRLKEADEDLRLARRLLEEEDVTSTLICAEVDSYEGSLRKDQRRLAEAATVLHRAATLYRLLGETSRLTRILVKLGLVHFQAQNFEEGVEATEKAIGLMEAEGDDSFSACAYYNLALLLHARGDIERAEVILDERAEDLEAAGELAALRVVWLRARIAWSREDLDEAERLFLATLERMRLRGIAFDMALVSLELSLIYLVQGRTSDVKRLSIEALQVFGEQEVEAEVFTALKLLAEAARKERATREMIERTIRFLEEASFSPRTSTREPS